MVSGISIYKRYTHRKTKQVLASWTNKRCKCGRYIKTIYKFCSRCYPLYNRCGKHKKKPQLN